MTRGGPPVAMAGATRDGRWRALAGPIGLASLAVLGLLVGLAVLSGGGDWSVGAGPPAGGGLLVTQVPPGGPPLSAPVDQLDLLYPPGSRVVLAEPGEDLDRLRVLSADLSAAGGPVLGPDGEQVLLVGKAAEGQAWQIYRVSLRGGRPVPVTRLPGGARDPVWLPEGRCAFSSPVARLAVEAATSVPSLFSQAITGGVPERLTFGLTPATDPAVLVDGRILFVSSVPGRERARPERQSLFTINNDGTEISPYAGQHDAPTAVRRPRETGDGRVVFLAAGGGASMLAGRIEQVSAARPFQSRSVTFPQLAATCRAVEPGPAGDLLVTLREPGLPTWAVYCLDPGAPSAGSPLFDDPGWDDVEAVPAVRPVRPMGRPSSVDPSRKDGLLLCLNANHTDRRAAAPTGTTGRVVRVFRCPPERPAELLGETPLHLDGSFLVRVPSETALAFEILDEEHRVLRRCPPAVWVRPGENRSCIGCHEPHNRAPNNGRPLAVRQPPVRLRSAAVPGPKPSSVHSTP